MKKFFIHAAWLSLCALGIGATCVGCNPRTDVPVKKVASKANAQTYKTAIDRQELDTTDDQWKVVMADTQIVSQRNPFRSIVDSIIAENAMRQKAQEAETMDTQLPEQLYPTRDYRVVGVITGTADAKVYVVDPSGNRFILRRGSLLGNNNGSISNIRRDGIEVYERVADKGQYIDIPLYDDINSDKKSKIQLSLQ